MTMPYQGTISVVYVVGHLKTCGPNLQLLYLISNLDRSRFKPIVLVTSAYGSPSEIEGKLERDGVEVIRSKVNKIVSMFEAPLRLAQIARRGEKVVLHPYGFRSDIICWLSRVRPRIGNVRNNLRYNYQRSFGKRLGNMIAAINLFFLGRSDLIISCGKSVRKNLAGLGHSSVAIRNGIDLDIYRDVMCSPVAPERNSHPEPIYLTISSRIPGKNIEFLVEEFALAPSGSRRLVVVGPVNCKLVEQYRSNSSVEFRGYVERPGDALIEVDFFISASEHEGIPNAVLESLVLGRPVVLSEIPAHLEIMQTVGHKVGSTFSWTSESLSAALKSVESENYRLISERSRQSALCHLSASSMASRYQLVYEALVSPGAVTFGGELEPRHE